MSKIFFEKIKNKKSKIGIIGLGYVGLELALSVASKGYKVYGFDKNIDKVKKIRNKKSPISTISSDKIRVLDANKIFDLRKINLINECDIIIICLPTPVKKNLSPDNSFLNNCIKMIQPYLREYQMIILESTVYPFGTKEIIGDRLKNFKIGKNFFLCFSPERVSPGQNELTKYSKITKLISGTTKNCLKGIKTFYEKIFLNVFECKSIETAEFTKLYENSYRAVNIGLANEMKIVCDKLKINIFDVIKAASTKPFGFKPFSPGPGVGGHCIPVDPLFISYVAKKFNSKADYVLLSRKVNIDITKWIINKIKKKIKKKKSKILLLGAAYKKNIDDARESPFILIYKELAKTNSINYFDPYVKKLRIDQKRINSLKKLHYEYLNKFDAVVLVTDHDKFNYGKILKYSKLIFDTRGVFKDQNNSKVVVC